MIGKLLPDRAALVGCIIGLGSLLPGWFNLKPNRLASGTSFKLWEGLNLEAAAFLAVLWLLCLILALSQQRKSLIIALGILLNVIVILIIAYSGQAATQMLRGQTELSRVALSSGVWTSLLGAFIGILSCSQRLNNLPVGKQLILWLGVVGIIVLLTTGWPTNVSLLVEFKQQRSQFIHQLGVHVSLFAGAVLIGTLIGIPLGIWAKRTKLAEKPIFFLINIMQTIPSLALFGLLIVPLSAISLAIPILRQWGVSGIGTAPAIIALVVYSLLPVTRNTYVGLQQIDPAVINAGVGMGMSNGQIFRKIELPLSIPIILEGVRTAAVQSVGNTAVAALIGAGGLGWFIFQGISQATGDMVILGAIPIMVLAIVVDIIMQSLVKASTPRGLSS
jgi:osmoprotectant transport system permease protein